MTKYIVKHRYFLSLMAIIIWGSFLRLYKIYELPFGLYPDVAANGLDAQDILDGKILPYYRRNGGREGMFFYVVAIFLLLFGNKPASIFLASSLIGIITLPMMCLNE